MCVFSKKGKVVYGQEPPSGESTTTECGFNYQLLAVITEVAQWRVLVAVNHNQLRTISSETVDPIDWSHPPPNTGQYPLSSTYCTLQCGLQITRFAALSQPRTCDFRMPDQCTAGVALTLLFLRFIYINQNDCFVAQWVSLRYYHCLYLKKSTHRLSITA